MGPAPSNQRRANIISSNQLHQQHSMKQNFKKQRDLQENSSSNNSLSCEQLSDCTGLFNTNSSNVCNNIMCDPNLGQCICMDQTMTGNQPTLNTSGSSCYHDEDCMHLDEDKSTWSNLVYACPSAKCNEGTCQCGTGCMVDSYSGICCQGLEMIGSDSFCIMSTGQPGLGSGATYVPLYNTAAPSWTQGPQGPQGPQWSQGPVMPIMTQSPMTQFTMKPISFQQTIIPLSSYTQGPN